MFFPLSFPLGQFEKLGIWICSKLVLLISGRSLFCNILLGVNYKRFKDSIDINYIDMEHSCVLE